MEIFEFAKQYGLATTCGLLILIAFCWLVKYLAEKLWLMVTGEFSSIRAAVANKQAEARAEHVKIWDAVQAMRSDVRSLGEKVVGLEAVTKTQQSTIQEHIKEMGGFSSKFEAIFRFIDAPGRRTDRQG